MTTLLDSVDNESSLSSSSSLLLLLDFERELALKLELELAMELELDDDKHIAPGIIWLDIDGDVYTRFDPVVRQRVLICTQLWNENRNVI
jgi:hypothetical protein